MRDASRETKIDQFDSLLGFIEQDIFKFDVSVGYIALVAIVDGLDDLAPEEFGLELGHLAIRLHL